MKIILVKRVFSNLNNLLQYLTIDTRLLSERETHTRLISSYKLNIVAYLCTSRTNRIVLNYI